jgi:hypothetical protein
MQLVINRAKSAERLIECLRKPFHQKHCQLRPTGRESKNERRLSYSPILVAGNRLKQLLTCKCRITIRVKNSESKAKPQETDSQALKLNQETSNICLPECQRCRGPASSLYFPCFCFSSENI